MTGRPQQLPFIAVLVAAGGLWAAPKTVPAPAVPATNRNAVVQVRSAPSELDIARAALRDGLWSVARAHAERVPGDAAKAVIVESLARERKWDDLLKRLVAWGNPAEEEFVYYRAQALNETGESRKAAQVLEEAVFADPVFVKLSARLLAKIQAASGDAARALATLRKAGVAEADEAARMTTAELMVTTGDGKGARRLWQAVADNTNATVQAYVRATVNLARCAAADGDFGTATNLAKSASSRAVGVELRRLAGFALGEMLVHDKMTLEEGAKLIRKLAKDAPDAPGARTAFVRLGDAYLRLECNAQAADVYRDAVETWPEVARDSAVSEGLGWALSRLGRNDEAYAAFRRAEETATNEVDKAMALMKQGDVLAVSGRGDEAMLRYREVIERYPKSAVSDRLKALVAVRELETKGRAAYRDYRFEEAREVFAKVAKADPARKSRMDYFDVLCLYGLGLDDEAEEKAKKICDTGKDAPIRADATLWLAKFSYNRGKWTDSGRLFACYADMVPKADEAPMALVWAARAAFAANDFPLAINVATRLAERYPDSPARSGAYLVQGEALIELARFDEAVLVLERVKLVTGAPASDRLKSAVTKADALFAMGADNPVRYQEALEGYRAIRAGENLTPGVRISVAFKIGRTLEKLKRMEEAIDQYYSQVVLAFREARLKGISFDDEARAAFSRAAFRLADEYESRGKDDQAMHVLGLVKSSGVPASAEAARRISRMQTKGNGL